MKSEGLNVTALQELYAAKVPTGFTELYAAKVPTG